jgi:P4 family phage/plasmid primase-like protien
LTENKEQPKFLLICPTCKKPVEECGKDSIQTWYSCEAGHKTAAPIKRELDGIEQFQKAFCERIEKSPEIADYKPSKVYPNFAFFCDDQENETGFKPARVSKWLAENEHFKTDRETDILYFGDEEKGIWTQDGEIELKKLLTKILGENNRESHYRNILHDLKSLNYTEVEFSKKIAVENGLLDVVTGELSEFTLREMAYHEIPTTYNPKAEVPHSWLEFLKQVLPSADIPTLQEWSGYLLYAGYPIHKVLWIHGEGRNGKGVYDRTMKGILGIKNCSGVGLEELDGNHRFALHRLKGKLYNPCSEPTTNRIFRTEIFQKITGGDLLSAERKGVQKTTEFTNYAKITVIGNKFPKIHNPTTAFKDRIMFVKFPFYFSEKERIPNLEKVWLDNPEAKSGILNWMLEGLHRLLANSHFTESKSQEETEIEFQRVSDSISAFLTETVVYGSNYDITRIDAYETYKEYCDMIGVEPENKNKFTDRLKHTPKIHDGWTRAKGKKERAWKGVTFKTVEDMENGTVATDGTAPYTLETFSNSKNESKRETGVPNVPTVPKFDLPLCWNTCRNYHNESKDGYGCSHKNPMSLTEKSVRPLKCPGFKPIKEEEA